MERRDFLKTGALSAAALAVTPTLSFAAPAAGKKAVKSANSVINLGFIGLGRQAMSLLKSFMKMEDVRVIAGCDVYDIKRNRFEERVINFYKERGEKKVKVDMYEDYQDLLARPDIDAVVIATPDHQHAVIAIAACKAGKDIYLEKPMTLTIFEGQMLCEAVRKYNRILQVGSQQRSSSEFIQATRYVREGLLGKIERVEAYVGRTKANPFNAAPAVCDLPRMEVPTGLNWDKWLGPMNDSVYYTETFNPSLHGENKEEKCWGAWRWYKPTGGGYMTDWGAHMFDIVQWALGKDGNGPVEVVPPGYGYNDYLTFKYDNGIELMEKPIRGFDDNGVKFFGENGWIAVGRHIFQSSDPKKFFWKDTDDNGLPYEESKGGHHRAFINSIRSRRDPNVPVETGHSSATVCNIGNIAIDLGRPVKWNPIVQHFMNDKEADEKMHYRYRDGYSLEV